MRPLYCPQIDILPYLLLIFYFVHYRRLLAAEIEPVVAVVKQMAARLPRAARAAAPHIKEAADQASDAITIGAHAIAETAEPAAGMVALEVNKGVCLPSVFFLTEFKQH